MKAGRSVGTRVVLASGAVGLGLLAMAVLPETVAGAAAKQVQIGNGTAVSVPKGWSAGKPSGGKVQITHSSPRCAVEIVTGTGVSATPKQQGGATFNSFSQGFGLSKVKETGNETIQIPGGGKFDEAYTFTYSGKLGKTTMGGLVAELQNSTTGAATFAVAIAKQSDKPKLKSAVNAIFNSLAAN